MSSSRMRRYLPQARRFHPRLTWLRAEEPRIRSHRLHAAPESDVLDPAQCALLVLDCQPEALNSVADSRSIVFRTNSAIDMMRRIGGQIAFTRLAFEDSDYRFTPPTNNEFSALARERRLPNGSFDADLHPGLAVAPDDIVVRKTRLGAFSTTNLDERLTNLGITTLILAGMHTGGAVLSTVREAWTRTIGSSSWPIASPIPTPRPRSCSSSRSSPSRRRSSPLASSIGRWQAGSSPMTSGLTSASGSRRAY